MADVPLPLSGRRSGTESGLRVAGRIRLAVAVSYSLVLVVLAVVPSPAPYVAPGVSDSLLHAVAYGVLAFLLVSAGRVGVRNLQRMLRQRGVGLWNAVIVGFNDVGRKLHHQLHYYPVWGFRVVGFIDKDTSAGEHLGKKVLG